MKYVMSRLLTFLAVYLASFSTLLVIRTLQAAREFGSVIDVWPVTALLHMLLARVAFSDAWLRLASYVVFALIAAVYLFAIASAARSHFGKGAYIYWVILPFGVMTLFSLLLYPHLSRPVDTIDYTMHARVQAVYAANPYVVPGSTYAHTEQLSQYMEAKQRPSVYGPAWLLISLLPALAGNGQPLLSILMFKLLFIVGELICLWLIYIYHTNETRDETLAVLSGVLVAWNPLLHLIAHGQGHNDVWMAVPLMVAFFALGAGRPVVAVGAWWLSGLVKFVTIPIGAPIAVLIWRRYSTNHRWRVLILAAICCAIISALLISPFGVQSVLASVSGRYSGLISTGDSSKAGLLADLLTHTGNLVGLSMPVSLTAGITGLALPLSWTTFAAVRSLWVRGLEDVTKVAVEILLVYITFVAMPVYAQYAITPVLLMGLLAVAPWHKGSVVVVSLALGLDSLLIVYAPRTLPTWERFLHQGTHIAVIAVVIAYGLVSFYKQYIISRHSSQLPPTHNSL